MSASTWKYADLVNSALRRTIGEAVTITPEGGTPYTIAAIFDSAYAAVELQGELEIAPVWPMVDLDLAVLPEGGGVPARGDRVDVASVGLGYRVNFVHLDGRNGAKLFLTEITA